MKQMARVLSVLLVIGMLFQLSVSAQEPYVNYSYNSDSQARQDPQAYIPTAIIDGVSTGTKAFSNPQDMFLTDEGLIYIADTGNNRIVVLGSDEKFLREITDFDNKGIKDSFNTPTGIFVLDNGDLYIADSQNERVVVLDKDDNLKSILNRPETTLLTNSETYFPLKVGVDSYNRIYLVVDGETNGILVIDKNGEFLSFIGAVQTTVSAMQAIKRMFMTDEQKKRSTLVIPTEYSNIDISDESFVYGTVGVIDPDNYTDSMFIHKINPLGEDVLNRNGIIAPMGDIPTINLEAKKEETEMLYSYLCDTTLRDSGIYAALDSRRGRVFTYDNEGNLMYVFGGIGQQYGLFKSPAALECFKDTYYVLDSGYNQIIKYNPTEYGNIITEAVRCYYRNDYDSVGDVWFSALRYTSTSEFIFDGIAESYFLQGDYEQAMKYFTLANDRTNYSDAYTYFRNEIVEKAFPILMTAIVILIIGFIVFKLIIKRRKKNAKP